MNLLTYLRYLLFLRDITTIVVLSTTGYVLQVLSNQYIKDHPEIFNESLYPSDGIQTQLKRTLHEKSQPVMV